MKTVKTTLILLICLGFVAPNTFAQDDEPYLVIGDGHTSWVNSVAFHPDGNTIASGSTDSTIKLWDANTGVHLNTLEGHTGAVWSIAFHPDGHTIASGSYDYTIKLWDTNTGKVLNTLEGHTDGVNSVAFHPDGHILASGGSWNDNTIRLWDANTGEFIRELKGRTRGVSSVAFHPDGHTIASGSWNDGTIRLWDTNTGEFIRELKGHTDAVYSVAFHPDGHTIASSSDDETIRLWDTNTGEFIRELKGHTDAVYRVAFHPDGHTIASGSWNDGTIRLWDTNTGEFIRELKGHTDAVYSVAFHPDGHTIASGNWDKTIRLWDAKTGENIRTLIGHTGFAGNVAFHPDGHIIASGSDDYTIRLWDAKTGVLLRTLTGHTTWVNSVAFHPDGHTIASGSNDVTIRLWDTNTGEFIRAEGYTRDVWSVAFHPDGHTIASGSDDNTIRLWDAKTGELLKTLTGHKADVWSVAFHPDGHIIASGSDDNTIRLWDAKTGENIRTLTGHTSDVWSIAFHPDGHTIASGGGGIWSGAGDKTIRLWDTSTGELLRTLTGHTDNVSSVAFHPDGHIIASGSYDNTIRLWDAKTGENIRTLTGHTSDVWSIAFHPDGHTIASGNWDGTILLWHVDIGGVAPDQQPPIMVSLSHEPLIVSSKKSLDLVATVENTGEVAAAVTLQFYGPVKVGNTGTDATQPTIDFTGKELGKAVNIKTLDAESKRNLGERTTFPDEPGTYAYKACIQRTDGAGETEEICSDVITVTVTPPDLQVKVWAESKLDKTWTKTTTVAPGEEFKLSATVSNDGGKSDKTALWFYLQDEDTESAKEVGGAQIYPLPTADGTIEVTKHITITAPETPGLYIYNASVDGFEGEEKSSNNYAEVKITVGGSGLVIESVQASRSILTLDDNEFTLSATVKNIGPTRSDSTTLRFYRSANEHISIDDTELAPDVQVPPLDPQKTFTHSFKTKAEYATQYLQPSIYYYGALVGSPANEINTDNNWSDNIVKVTVNVITGFPYQGIYRLNVPPDLISEVAYSQGYTYFLLKAECFEVAGLEANAEVSRYPYVYQNKNCAVRLYLSADNLSDDPVNNPAYFMFYVEAPRDKLSDIAKEGAIEVFQSIIWTAIGEVAGKIVDSVGGLFTASFTTGMQVGQIIMSYDDEHSEAEDQTPTVKITDPKKSRLCLLLVPGRLSSVEVSIVQNYKFLIVDGENPDGTLSDLTKAHYGNTWNLEEIWRLENPDLAAAPGAPSMSLTDYPLFQYLPSEVQAYILQYFGEDGGIGTVHPEALQIPQQTSLLANYPNPFNPETWIPYQLSKPADVKLTIYDINGHVVRDLDLGHQVAGTYQRRSRAAHWDGKNESGEAVASGVYFYKFTAGDFSATRKMSILK